MIEKSLNPAPQGLAALSENEEPLEIEIEDPEAVTIRHGDDIILQIQKEVDEEKFNANLAEEISDDVLESLASDLINDFESDISARKDWVQTYVDGLELLGLNMEDRSEPWEGACGVYHPLLTEAVIKFQAETITATFPASGPVKTQIIGKETQEKKEASQRVQDDMNYQLTDVMTEYRPEHERMLWGLGLAGNAFKKVYYDPYLGRQVSMYVPAEDMVVPYGAADLQSAERVTHVMRKTENEIRRLQYEGFYRDIDLGEPSNTMDDIEKKIADKLGFRASTDDRFKLLEMHVEINLEGFEHEDHDGEQTDIALPYIVTIEKGTNSILSIRRNWNPDDESCKKRNHFVHYGYVPGFGFYCLGLIHLIGGFAKSSTSILRQLVDAGTLSNLPGGFKTRGLRVKGDDTPISPGEWRDVDVPSGVIRDNFFNVPYKEPSQTLLTLLGNIVDEGRKFAGSDDLSASDMSANAPVGTTLAILERTLKVMSAVQSRVHYSMKQEFILLRDIIRDYTPDEYDYEPTEGGRHAKKADYDLVYVLPVSDPNAATMAQRVVQYQAALALAQQAPQLYNMPVLHRQMLEVLGIPNYQKLVPMNDDMKPRDPVTENQNILKSKPVKAFLYQDHQAHITVHMAAMQSPEVQQVLQQSMGQNPQALQALQAAMSAHINEHLGYEYRKQIEKQMGHDLPSYGEDDEDNQVTIPEEMELQISKLAAQASQQLLQQGQQQAKQQAAQQQTQDPLIQMQQQEIQIKQQDLQRKAAKDQSDAQIEMLKIQVDRERIGASQESAGANVAASMQNVDKQLTAKQNELAAKLGVDVALKEGEHTHQKHQTGQQHAHQRGLAAMQAAQSERQAQQRGGEVGGKKPEGFKDGGKITEKLEKPTEPNLTDQDKYFQGKFNTNLDEHDESKFQKWAKENKKNPDMESIDYDLRGMWKGDSTFDNSTGHGADTYKKPNHPTFSDQSKYHGAVNEAHGGNYMGGRWQSDPKSGMHTYTPSDEMLNTTHDRDQMIRYIHENEPKTFLILPKGGKD